MNNSPKLEPIVYLWVKGRIANFGIILNVFEFLGLGWLFPCFKKIEFLGILGPPYCGIGATIRIGIFSITLNIFDIMPHIFSTIPSIFVTMPNFLAPHLTFMAKQTGNVGKVKKLEM